MADSCQFLLIDSLLATAHPSCARLGWRDHGRYCPSVRRSPWCRHELFITSFIGAKKLYYILNSNTPQTYFFLLTSFVPMRHITHHSTSSTTQREKQNCRKHKIYHRSTTTSRKQTRSDTHPPIVLTSDLFLFSNRNVQSDRMSKKSNRIVPTETSNPTACHNISTEFFQPKPSSPTERRKNSTEFFQLITSNPTECRPNARPIVRPSASTYPTNLPADRPPSHLPGPAGLTLTRRHQKPRVLVYHRSTPTTESAGPVPLAHPVAHRFLPAGYPLPASE